MSGYGSILGAPQIVSGPGSLAPIYTPTNPALAIFDSASENPTAASLGMFSPTGLTQISSSGGTGYGSFTHNSGAGGYAGYSSAGLGAGYLATGLGGSSQPGRFGQWLDRNIPFLGPSSDPFGAGNSATGAKPSGIFAIGNEWLGTAGLFALGIVLLLGAFIYMSRTQIREAIS